MSDQTLTVGSLFSGIGGFDLGFERAGFDIRWQVEIDPFCQRVLAKNWPNVRRYGDVRHVMGHAESCGRRARGTWRSPHSGSGVSDCSCWDRRAVFIEPVDVLCGGFPCQPHSLAGRRAAAADDRDLWPEFMRLIRELRPRWVVAENVPGLLSSEAGRFFGGILRDLAESGYDAEWDCLPACAFGAPHRRDRVWLVAYPMCGGCEERPVSERQERHSVSDAARRGSAKSDMAFTAGAGWDETGSIFTGATNARRTEPDVRGMADGLSEGLHNARRWLDSEGDQDAGAQGAMRTLRDSVTTRLASQGLRSEQQRHRELGDALLGLSYRNALGDREASMAAASRFMHGLREACQAIGFVRDASLPSLEAWFAAPEESQAWAIMAARRGPWVDEWPDVPRV